MTSFLDTTKSLETQATFNNNNNNIYNYNSNDNISKDNLIINAKKARKTIKIKTFLWIAISGIYGFNDFDTRTLHKT